ncbi:hypothetical protein V2J09_019292 [Rumex salicifolius]
MQKMLATWCAIKKSLSCESNASDVYDPQMSSKSSCISKCRPGYSCKPISQLNGVVDGSKRRRTKKRTIQSPLSIRSSELLNPITHQVRFSNTDCELKITRLGGGLHSRDFLSRNSSSSSGSRITTCDKCGQSLKRREDVESHHLSNHAVTELIEGDPSRNVIERIIQTRQWTPDDWVHSSRILKVHNLQTTLAQFEEYREMVKIRAHNLSKKHPRCLADGNELLRFYCTTFSCSLGENGLPTLCRSDICNLCCILRHGFKANKSSGDLLSVFTASKAEEAYKYMQQNEVNLQMSKALILCRVIAGRVQKPVDRSLDKAAQSGFDSVAGKLGPNYSIEKLYSLNSSALLPCFVVVCKS